MKYAGSSDGVVCIEDRLTLLALGGDVGTGSTIDVMSFVTRESNETVGLTESGFRRLPPEREQERRVGRLRAFGRRVWGMLVAAGAFLAKFGALVYKLKIVTVAGSMVVSVGAYALLGGWWFGVGLVGLIFVHEMGHVVALRRQGVPASAPLFIPFMGAVIGMKKLPANAWREAEVALAGPILGSLGAAAVWAAGGYFHSRFLTALAFIGFFLNLFNLIPVVPLDGGRAVAALHPAIWLLGLAGLVTLEMLRPSPILPLIIVIGGLELWRRWRSRGLPGFAGYYRVTAWQRTVVATVYLGLAALLVLAMSATQVPRSF
jgi:Zn-dependent protease